MGQRCAAGSKSASTQPGGPITRLQQAGLSADAIRIFPILNVFLLMTKAYFGYNSK
jgi:hypothetical protein